MNDVLIRADDIIEHYNTLKKHHPHLAYVKLFEGFSHIDFTYGSHHALSQEILSALKQHAEGGGVSMGGVSIIREEGSGELEGSIERE